MKINRSNYEIWFIDSLDGNLSSLEAEELNQFLNENPDLKEEFNELTPVIINQSVHQFKDKESLKKINPIFQTHNLNFFVLHTLKRISLLISNQN